MISLWNQGAGSEDLELRLNSADGAEHYVVPIHLAPGASDTVDLAALRASGQPDASGESFPQGALAGNAMLMPAGIPAPNATGRIVVPATGFWTMHNIVLSSAVFNAHNGTCCFVCSDCCGYSCPSVAIDGMAFVAVGSTFLAYMTVEDVTGGSDDCSQEASWGDNGLATYDGLSSGEAKFTANAPGNDNVIGSLVNVDIPYYGCPDCPNGCPTGGLQNETPITFSPPDQCGDPTVPQAASRGALINEYVSDGVAWMPGCADFTNNVGPGFFTYSQLTTDDSFSWAVLTNYFLANINQTRSDYGSPLTVNSGYRDPEKEKTIDSSENLPFYRNSRHVYGDGIDFYTGDSQPVYTAIRASAWKNNVDGGIGCVEPADSTYSHVHADWRTDPNARNRSSSCPTTSSGYWGKQ